MATREVISCDKCGIDVLDDHVVRINIPNGVSHEFGGHKTETYFDFEKKELCPRCANKLLIYLLSHTRTEEGWKINRYLHPRPATNDAVYLTLKFFDIKDKN